MPSILPDYNELDVNVLEPFTKIKLVAIDLDGTLLKSNNSILPRKVLEHSRKLRIKDIRITIATGRTLNGSRALLEMLQIRNDTPIILYNGSVIINNKYEVLKHISISSEDFKKVIKISSKYKVKLIAYCYDWLIGNEPREHAIGCSSLDKPGQDYNKMPVYWLDWEDEIIGSYSPSALVIHTCGDKDITSRMNCELATIPGISYTHGKTYIEVGPQDCNKGKALEFAAKALGLSREQVLALGDNDNDACMLAWAGIGVAVNSASDLARASSDFLTKRGVLDGTIEMLNMIHTSKRYFNKS